MKFGSLFAGIGGIDLGLERAGMTCAWQVEIDRFCLDVLEKHWPDVPKYGDVKEITELPYVDLIAGGFPCQPISIAGHQRYERDERWLWPQFIRIICMVRPKYILVENVANLLSQGIDRILGDLAASGFDAEWQSIPAKAFGAPHQRNRIFIVAYTNGERSKKTKRVFSGKFIQSVDKYFAQGALSRATSGRIWLLPPSEFQRMVDGIPSELDRYRTLGNAVVPQVVEWIGQRILEFDNESSRSNQ